MTKAGFSETFLAIGGGSAGYGLWIDGCLSRGRSVACEAFNNRPLAGGDFEIRAIELYAIRSLEDHDVSPSISASLN